MAPSRTANQKLPSNCTGENIVVLEYCLRNFQGHTLRSEPEHETDQHGDGDVVELLQQIAQQPG